MRLGEELDHASVCGGGRRGGREEATMCECGCVLTLTLTPTALSPNLDNIHTHIVSSTY